MPNVWTTKKEAASPSFTARQFTYWEWSKKWFSGSTIRHNEYDGSANSGIRWDSTLLRPTVPYES